MNERLKEIAIKAQVEHCISHVRLVEFAELIIRECGDIADSSREGATFPSCLMKKHFGVNDGTV